MVTIFHGIQRFDGHKRCVDQIKHMLKKASDELQENPEIYEWHADRSLNVKRKPAEPSDDPFPEEWLRKLVY